MSRIFEYCYEIYDNVKYLKGLVLYLTGNKEYAWIDLDSNRKEIDHGEEFFKETTRSYIQRIVRKIKETEPLYECPEIKYGNYFEKPKSKEQKIRDKEKIIAIIIQLALVIIIIMMTFWILYTAYQFNDFSSLTLFIILICCFHVFGTDKTSVINVIQN